MNDALERPSGCAGTTEMIVRRLMNAADGDVLRLGGGVWHFDGNGAHEAYFAPSNNANGIKRIVFPLIGKKNITIDGEGAELIFQDRLFPFIISGCENITIRNIMIDFSFMRYAVARIMGCDENGFDLFVDEEKCPWRVKNGNWEFQAGSEWRTTAEKKFFLAGGMKKPGCCYLVAGDTKDPLFNLAAPLVRADARRIEKDHVRFDYREGSVKIEADSGQRMIVSNDENRENDLFFIENSRGVTVENVEIVRGAGMGFIAQMSSDLTFDNVRVHVKEGRDEPQGITADVFHFVNCSGSLVIKNAQASDSLDDAVNIHGVYTQVESVNGKEAVCRIGHQEQYGLNPYRAGDRIRVTKGDGSEERSRLTVASSVLSQDEKKLTVTFGEAAEGLVSEGDYIDNPDRSPEVLIEGADFVRCPRVLLGSSKKTVVRNCRFTLNGALTVVDGMSYWFEAGLAEDVLIENNVFENSGLKGLGAMAVELKGGGDTKRAHKNIRIINNTVIGSDVLLDARLTDGLTVCGNKVTGGRGEIRLTGCRHVSID